uniref:Uncharacterized protein n=1 Tax=Avena sativa TaxID=4498 RepID=A0ACD5WG20_AVESA
MANPAYFQSAPLSRATQKNELHFHLYMHQHLQGEPNGGNQQVVVDSKRPQSFGCIAANDWTIYDGLGPDANLVARAQGLHVGAGMAKENWFVCFNMVFTDDRFKGSSFKVLGDFQTEEGEFAIVGGTGEFAFAQGVVTFKKIEELKKGNIRELNIHALCLTFPKPSVVVTKIGPWGGDGGKPFDVPETPRRIESVTICSVDTVDSLAFTYVDQAGQKQSSGRLGGVGGRANTIEFSPSEIVKGVSGTIGSQEGNKVVKSLTIVTNVTTYGPYGKAEGTPFTFPVPDNSQVVGFHGRGTKFVDAIGVYVLPITN